ncbi:MAG: hypothetical protein R8M45_05035 [Ghiorsea sp.]
MEIQTIKIEYLNEEELKDRLQRGTHTTSAGVDANGYVGVLSNYWVKGSQENFVLNGVEV